MRQSTTLSNSPPALWLYLGLKLFHLGWNHTKYQQVCYECIVSIYSLILSYKFGLYHPLIERSRASSPLGPYSFRIVSGPSCCATGSAAGCPTLCFKGIPDSNVLKRSFVSGIPYRIRNKGIPLLSQ